MGRKPKKQVENGGLNGGSSGAVVEVKPLSSESEEDSQVYEVHSIIASRVNDSGRLFLVKWEGFSDEHNTWEPEDNLSGSIDKVKDYMVLRKSWMEKMPAAKKAKLQT